MSCKRQLLGTISGLPEVISFLEGAHEHGWSDDVAMEQANDWPDPDPASWEWSDDTSAPGRSDPPPAASPGSDSAAAAAGGEAAWLDEACVAISPLGDLLVVAVDERIAVLSAQWDSESAQSRFALSAQLTAPDHVPVTSLLCQPMASPQRSAVGGADWTCLVVGQESGHVAFFTEDGSELLRQRLHETAVCGISCCSRQLTAAAEEQLTVVFQDAVVSLDGFALFQTLRACRSRLARLRAEGGGEMAAPPLAQRKWQLRHQQRVSAAETVGFRSGCLFDQLAEESLLRPAVSLTSAGVPAAELLVTTGRCPFVGFFHASESAEQARLEQVVRGVASKVKDTVFSTIGYAPWNIWSGGATQKPSKPEPDIELGTAIKCRFGLPDVQRDGQLLALSRDRRLSAVTDSFGRVTLVDNHAAVARAMWKGYREAQCAWLEVREPRGSTGDGRRAGRRAAFLALYAPRRGLLELWTAAGGKVAAFCVSKRGRLLNISHGVIGQTSSEPSRGASSLLQCVFVAPDGRLSTLDVPFHLALSERGARRAHSHHLLRQLRALLRPPPPPAQAGAVLGAQLRQLLTAGARAQALQAVLACRRLDAAAMEAAVDTVLELCAAQEASAQDAETQQLLQTALHYRRLLSSYAALLQLGARPADSPAGLPGRPADSPAGPPGRPADSPAEPPGRPADSPAGPPGRPADSPAAPPGRPAESPAGLPGPPADSPAESPGRPAAPTVQTLASALRLSSRAAADLLMRLQRPDGATGAATGDVSAAFAAGTAATSTAAAGTAAPSTAPAAASAQPERSTDGSTEQAWRAEAPPAARVRFAEPTESEAAEAAPLSVCRYLRCFVVTPAAGGPQGGASVALRVDLSEQDTRALGDLLFGPCLRPGGGVPPDWQRAAPASGAHQLLRLLASWWLQLPTPPGAEQLLSLQQLLLTLMQLPGDVSWQSVQQLVFQSRHVQRALLLATVCRAVAARLEQSPANPGRGQCVDRPSHVVPSAGGRSDVGQPPPSDTCLEHGAPDATESPSAGEPSIASGGSEGGPAAAAEVSAGPEDSPAAGTESAMDVDPASLAGSGAAPESAEAEAVDEVGREPDDDWEQLSERTLGWDLLLDQLADAALLCDALPAAASADVTPQTLLKNGPGAVSELVARWLLTEGCRPDDLASAASNSGASASASTAPPEDAAEARAAARTRERAETAEEAREPPLNRLTAVVARLAARFPHSVAGDALLLNCAWEEAAGWARRRDLCQRLGGALEFAARIRDPHVRYGGCTLLWTGVLRQPAGAAAALLQLSGRCPDDASCRRELQLPAAQLPQLITCCRQLFQLIVTAMVECETEPPAVLYNDNLWASDGGGRARPASLLQMAARQKRCAEDLVALHLQLMDVMRAQVHLNLKNVHPYHCFNERDRRFMFGDLAAVFKESTSVDQAVRAKREHFLCRCTSAAVRRVYSGPNGAANATEAVLWTARCEQLAQLWDVPADVVRRQYTLDLYNCGYDQLAAEALCSVSQPAAVASQLLLLAGARVRHHIQASAQMVQLLGRLSMPVADFLKIADVELQCAAAPLPRTLQLLRQVARLEPDTPAERRVTLELIELVDGLVRAADHS